MLCGGSVVQGATPEGKAAHLACGDYNALSLMVVAGLGEWLLGSEHLRPVEEAGLVCKVSQLLLV